MTLPCEAVPGYYNMISEKKQFLRRNLRSSEEFFKKL